MPEIIQFLIKTLVSALLISLAVYVGKKSTLMGAILISLPINSILAMIWLFLDTNNVEKVRQYSNSIILILIPSILFFVFLSLLLKKDVAFFKALLFSCGGMVVCYYVYVRLLSLFGVKL